MRTFGLTLGICAAILLNLPMLEWETMTPLTIGGVVGVACVIWSLIKEG